MFENGAKRERGIPMKQEKWHNPSWEKPQKRRVDVTVMLAEIIQVEDRNPTYTTRGSLPELVS
jgi:hypothetical protein